VVQAVSYARTAVAPLHFGIARTLTSGIACARAASAWGSQNVIAKMSVSQVLRQSLSWERRATAQLQKPRWSWALPGTTLEGCMPMVRHQDVNAWMTSPEVTTSAWRGKRRWVRKSWTSAS
jgi:hypothetical protein